MKLVALITRTDQVGPDTWESKTIVLDGFKVLLAMQAKGRAITLNEPDLDYDDQEELEDEPDIKEVIH